MKSCEEFLTEIREKVAVAEDQLRSEKNNFCKNCMMYKEQREQWEKELKSEQLKVHNKEKELKKMEQILKDLRSKNLEVIEMEAVNDKLEKELEKAKKQHTEEQHHHQMLTEPLEKELMKLQDERQDLRVSNEWAKAFQEKELRVKEAENEKEMKEQMKELSDEFNSKLDDFEDYLKDLERLNIKPKQQKLNELKETLAMLKGECEDMEKKNRELEAEIATLKGFANS